MNLTALQARVALRFRDTTNRIVKATEWTDYLNAAYMDVVGEDPNWPFLESRVTTLSVSAGAGEITLPTDVWRVLSVYNATDKIPLAPIPGGAQVRHYFPDPANGLGMPLYYRLRANILEVYPWAASTTEIDVDVAVPPALLSAGGDEPVFPEQYHDLLVLGALSKVFEDDGNDGKAAGYQARFDRKIAQMKYDLLSTRTEGYPQVIDAW